MYVTYRFFVEFEKTGCTFIDNKYKDGTSIEDAQKRTFEKLMVQHQKMRKDKPISIKFQEYL